MSTPARCSSGGWPPIVAAGMVCRVAAPSKLQQPAGDRVKTDARDAAHIGRPTGAPVVVDKRRHRERLGQSTCTADDYAQSPDPRSAPAEHSPPCGDPPANKLWHPLRQTSTNVGTPTTAWPVRSTRAAAAYPPSSRCARRRFTIHSFHRFIHIVISGVYKPSAALLRLPGCGCGSSAGRFAISSTGPGPPRSERVGNTARRACRGACNGSLSRACRVVPYASSHFWRGVVQLEGD